MALFFVFWVFSVNISSRRIWCNDKWQNIQKASWFNCSHKKIEGAGTQFDPEIAEAMLDLIKTEKIKLNYSDLLGQIGLAETLNTLYPDKEFYDAAD